MGQQMSPQVVCCQHENLGNRRGELKLWEEDLGPDGLPQMRGCSVEPQDFSVDPDDWKCCRARDDYSEPVLTHSSSLMESLSYMPVRFDPHSTIDEERSHSRYSKIVVHSTRARTQRRSKAWEEWLRAATAGRSVTLLSGTGLQTPRGNEKGTEAMETASYTKVEATYYLDRALTKLSILPAESNTGEAAAMPPITIMVDNIQVICPLTDFMLLSEVVEAQLDEGERSRAALLQYQSEGSKQKRVCFLEESENAKDRFVQALTALWLEKRNDHSMWF
jgi:hypothetical protein|mmetsp:Transcript_54111/g.86043  ORF Transcript_54111/g.86043 Transcript_54111/m.86043 type:complete len:277 (+) Transcript_54111:93-923(+)